MNILEAVEQLPKISESNKGRIILVWNETAAKLLAQILEHETPEVTTYLRNLYEIEPNEAMSYVYNHDKNISILAEHMVESSKATTRILSKALEISLPDKPLLKSPWAVVKVSKNWLIDGYYNSLDSNTNNISEIEKEYGVAELELNAIKKAISNFLLHTTIKNQFPSAYTIQICLSIILKSQQLNGGRGSNYNPNKQVTVWVSGSILDEEIADAIIPEIYHEYGIESFSRNSQIPSHQVLAWMWDQILAASVNSISKLHESIQYIAKELRSDRRDSFHWKNK